jgi:hypothetical protein
MKETKMNEVDKKRIIDAAIALGFIKTEERFIETEHLTVQLHCTEDQLCAFAICISGAALEQVGFKSNEDSSK